MPTPAPPPDLATAVGETAQEQIILARGPLPAPPTPVRPREVRPGTPGYGPITPPTVRPNYPRIPYGQQTQAERMQSVMDAQRALERDSEVEVETATGENTVEGPSAYDIRHKRRRRRNCCRADRFYNEWLTAGNTIANKREPRVTFTRYDFVILERSQVFIKRGIEYQYFVTQDEMEYRASGGGISIWADGQESNRCWLVECKYKAGARDWIRSEGGDPSILDRPISPFPLPGGTTQQSQGPELRPAPTPPPPPGQDDQMRRYGKVINAPDPPAQECWNIGMRVVISQRGYWIHEYKNRMLRYNISGRVEWRRAPQRSTSESLSYELLNPNDRRQP